MHNNTSLGKASLWISIAGVVFPVTLAVLVITSHQHRLDIERLGQWSYALCGVLFVILELLALGCGIAARSTVAGKRGLAISAFAWILLSSVLTAFGGTPLPSFILSVVLFLLFLVTLFWRLLSLRRPDAGSPEIHTDRP
jgi:hypothetical protein